MCRERERKLERERQKGNCLCDPSVSPTSCGLTGKTASYGSSVVVPITNQRRKTGNPTRLVCSTTQRRCRVVHTYYKIAQRETHSLEFFCSASWFIDYSIRVRLTFKDGVVSSNLPDDAIVDSALLCKSFVLGHFIGYAPQIGKVNATMNRIWQTTSKTLKIDAQFIGATVILFKIDDEAMRREHVCSSINSGTSQTSQWLSMSGLQTLFHTNQSSLLFGCGLTSEQFQVTIFLQGT